MAEPETVASGSEAHWDAAYRDRGTTGVSWFQPAVTVSIELIDRFAVRTDAAVIDIGGGASYLVDTLAARGFSDLSVLDISGVALEAVGRRLGPAVQVTIVHEDVLTWTPARRYDLWHDRAVFHFLVDPGDREHYLDTVARAVDPGGMIILGTFAADGPQYCSGLPVARYSPGELSAVLGHRWELLAHEREEHVTPAGVTQPFTWVAARRLR